MLFCGWEVHHVILKTCDREVLKMLLEGQLLFSSVLLTMLMTMAMEIMASFDLQTCFVLGLESRWHTQNAFESSPELLVPRCINPWVQSWIGQRYWNGSEPRIVKTQVETEIEKAYDKRWRPKYHIHSYYDSYSVGSFTLPHRSRTDTRCQGTYFCSLLFGSLKDLRVAETDDNNGKIDAEYCCSDVELRQLRAQADNKTKTRQNHGERPSDQNGGETSVLCHNMAVLVRQDDGDVSVYCNAAETVCRRH